MPQALFVCNDAMAIGALSALAELGLAVPNDVSVIGFDDISLSRYIVPPLTTVRTPIAEAGRKLCRLLLDRIAGTLPDKAQWLPVDCELVLRGTTAPPRQVTSSLRTCA